MTRIASGLLERTHRCAYTDALQEYHKPSLSDDAHHFEMFFSPSGAYRGISILSLPAAFIARNMVANHGVTHGILFILLILCAWRLVKHVVLTMPFFSLHNSKDEVQVVTRCCNKSCSTILLSHVLYILTAIFNVLLYHLVFLRDRQALVWDTNYCNTWCRCAQARLCSG